MQATQILKIRLRRIKDRCYNPHNKSYKNYGGRGITICDEWLNHPESFVNWSLENGYEDGLSIDRIDNNNGYSPDNCRWVTIKENNQNRRSSKVYTYDGKTMNLTQWCNFLNLDYNTILMRIRRGNTFEEAISKITRKRDTSSLIGKRFGKLTVLEFYGINRYRYSMFICQCDCGKKVIVSQNKLKSGHTRSCGCLRGKNHEPEQQGF